MYNFTNSYSELQLLRMEVEDMEDVFLVEEVHDLWYTDEVEAVLNEYWSNGCFLDDDMREVLIVFYVITHVDDCLFIMDEGEF